MDSRVVQSHVNENNDQQNLDSQQVVTHDAEEQSSIEPEKKSVMSRVKARARKIKNSITGHGQQAPDQTSGHNTEIQHTTEDDDDDDDVDDGELDEDKENVQGPLLHQAPPIYGSRDATPTSEYEKVEKLGNSGIDLDGTKVVGEGPHHDPLFKGVSSTSETNQNIATDKAKAFAVEEKPEQFKDNFERPIVSKEDSQEQGSGTEAYTLPNYQTRDTDPNVYDSEDVKSATPKFESEQIQNLGNSGFDFDSEKVKEEEPRRDSLIKGVSSTTTETNENIAKPFAVEDKPDQFKANLEKPGFSEDFEEQGSRIEAYTLPKYQTNDNYPSEGEFKDIKPLEESLERLNVRDNESKPITEPKIQSHVATDTDYPPSAGSHDQFVPHFSDATKTQNEYPQETVSADISRNQEFLEEDSQDQGSRTEGYSLPGYQTRDTDPSGARSDEIKDFTPLEESLERLNVHDDEPKPITEEKVQPFVAETEYPASAGTGSHDIPHSVPHFFDASKSHNEFSQETVSKGINKNHENPSETEETFNTIANTAENQPGYEESVETQPKHNKSYADEIETSSVTTADKTLPSENDEAFKLSNDGTSTGTNANDGTETKIGDKGAAVRDYFTEKIRPGQEDKALAEVISEALHKGKDEPLKSEDGKLDSEVEKPEKVFEESNVASPEKGYVDKFKGVVGSWFAKSEENPSPHGAGIGTEDFSKNKDSVAEVKQDGKVVDEGRIQE